MIVNLKANNNGCIVEVQLDDDDFDGRTDKKKFIDLWAKELTAVSNLMASGIVNYNKMDPNEPATENQKHTMDKYGIGYSDQITYLEAHRLISKSMGQTKKK